MADNKKRRRADHNSSDSDDDFTTTKTIGKSKKTPNLSKKSLPFQKSLKPDTQILTSLTQLATTTATTSATPLSLSTISPALAASCLEVTDLSLSSVQSQIETLIFSITNSILAGNGFSFSVPSRSSSNQLYVPELDRIVLKDKKSIRPFSSVATVRKTTITTKILSLIHQLCRKSIHVTKRDLFYTDVKLFQDQNQSDAVLDDVACLIGCTRSSLNVVASEKGVVVGRLVFSDNGDMIDCTKMGVGGKAIPPNIDRVGDISSDALFVLLVEKDAAFMRLAEDRFYNRFPCIIMTAKGQPDVATRLFLRKIKLELKLPVLALVDSDPYGLKILSVYGCGSKNMSYDSANLTTPDIKWLGIRPSDLDKYQIPDECRLPMTEQDIKTGKDLLEEDFVKKNPGWVKELELMVKSKQKAEIQALSTFGFQYLSEVYLPLKLQQRPFNFEKSTPVGGFPTLPKLHLNPYSWSKVSHNIYLDSPAGTGHSYSLNSSDYNTGDFKSASDTHTFLLEWFYMYQEFVANPFFIAGESFAGIYIPTLAAEIVKGLDAGLKPVINLKGYMIGNGCKDEGFDGNALVPFVHGMGLISDDLYQPLSKVTNQRFLEVFDGERESSFNHSEAVSHCQGKYYGGISADCQKSLSNIDKQIWRLNIYDILEPCYHGPYTQDDDVAHYWLNDADVRKSLHAVEMRTTGPWELCTFKVTYIHDAGSMMDYHKNLTERGYRALIYSGDHDMCVPYTGSAAWTKSLGYQIMDAWRPWLSNDQVAGYTVGYDKNLTFLTIKGIQESLLFYTNFLVRK